MNDDKEIEVIVFIPRRGEEEIGKNSVRLLKLNHASTFLSQVNIHLFFFFFFFLAGSKP